MEYCVQYIGDKRQYWNWNLLYVEFIDTFAAVNPLNPLIGPSNWSTLPNGGKSWGK